MSTPTTTEQDDLRSRLPDPSQYVPEVAGIAGAMFKATLNGSIPETTIHLVQHRAGQIVGSTYHTRQAWPPAGHLLAVGLVLRAVALGHRRLLPPVHEADDKGDDDEQVDGQDRPAERDRCSTRRP